MKQYTCNNIDENKNLHLEPSILYEGYSINDLTMRIQDIRKKDNIKYINNQQLLSLIIEKNKDIFNNEDIKEVFIEAFLKSLQKVDNVETQQKLLISSKENKFKSIQEMFNLENDKPIIIAGVCAIENYDYLDKIGRLLNDSNVKIMRGGAYKPRTSPYEFQGLRLEGLKMLKEVGRKYNLITVTEVLDTRDVELISKYADILQIGARNMQNFELLKEVGRSKKPVILKRGLSATIEELKFAAEYIALEGNRKIILCERGIRTFEQKVRNTLDISSIPIIKNETCLPVIADLSHSLARKDIMNPISKAVLAAGADGFMVEVHPQPELALSDSKQQLNPMEFTNLINYLEYK